MLNKKKQKEDLMKGKNFKKVKTIFDPNFQIQNKIH